MKIGIFIDGLTLYYSLKGKTFHFREFKDWLIQQDELVFAGYFNSVDNAESKKAFFSHVNKSGFDLFIRKPIYNQRKDTLSLNQTNMELSIEVINRLKDFDKVIIVSGKHDFLPLCEKIVMSGKIVEVISMKHVMNNCYNKYSKRYIDDFLIR